MSGIELANSARTTCATALASSGADLTSKVLVNTSGFPASPGRFYIRIDDTGTPGSTLFEIALVTGNNTGTNTFTWTRGSPQAFATGATITYILSKEALSAAFVRLDTAASQTLT